MALNDIKFVKGNGALGGVLPNQDHVSAFLFYMADIDLPEGFGTDDRIKMIGSVAEAEALGITTDNAKTIVFHYHISEFFRLNTNAELWVMIGAAPTGETPVYDFKELAELQNHTEGKIRQAGIYITETFDNAMIATIQGIVDDLEDTHKPLSVLFAADLSAATLSTLDNLRTETAPSVSVIIGQDGNGVGAALFETKTYSITCIGAVLGALSLASVHENIGWVEKFRMSGTELDVPAFADGTLVKDCAESLLTAINEKGYIFLRKHTGIAGSYLNDSPTCVALTSDYAWIERNRTIDKAIRGIRTYLLPKLNSPLEIDATSGKLSLDTIKVFENLAAKPLEAMQRDGELSGFKVTINPAQDVLTTSKLEVTVQLVIYGVARTIEVTVGFAKSV